LSKLINIIGIIISIGLIIIVTFEIIEIENNKLDLYEITDSSNKHVPRNK